MSDDLLETLYDSSVDYEHRIKPFFHFVLMKTNESMSENRTAYLAINPLLKNFDPDRAENIMCISVLRSTYQLRDFLQEWEGCRDRIVQHFESQPDIDTKQLLRGLL